MNFSHGRKKHYERVGSALIELALRESNNSPIIVDAVPEAIGFYYGLGFRFEKEIHGKPVMIKICKDVNKDIKEKEYEEIPINDYVEKMLLKFKHENTPIDERWIDIPTKRGRMRLEGEELIKTLKKFRLIEEPPLGHSSLGTSSSSLGFNTRMREMLALDIPLKNSEIPQKERELVIKAKF